jgi:uncharacterized iron-regulated membrane protein
MKQGLRQSMASFHTWAGLLMGWLLFVMFVSGTCAYFQEEITRWMQPEVAQGGDPASAADGASRWLQTHAAGSTDWYITLPGKRSATTALFWTRPEGAAADAPNEATLDARGAPVQARQTAGGFFLYRFHFDLHYMPVLWARYLVGAAAMFMLVAILSGVITHKKIFVDFFLLRFGKGQRSWLDAHNVTAVLALPFYLMITYTGLVTLDSQLMPAPIAAVYASEDGYYADAFPQASGGKKTGRAAPLAPLSPMIAQARARWDGADIGYVYVSNPGDAAASVTLSSSPGASMDARGQSLRFDGVTGRIRDAGGARGAAQSTEAVMIGLHAGRYADTVLRWLYFLSGVGGTVMVATGLILWTVKRRTKLADPQRPHIGFRIVERLNIGVIIGFPIGLAGYFLANRLLSLGLAGRADWEIDCLFLVWGGAFLLALLRPARRAWIELSGLCAILLASVPLVSAVTTGRSLPGSLIAGDWLFVSFELVVLLFAAGFAFASWTLAKAPAGQSRPRARRKAVPA